MENSSEIQKFAQLALECIRREYPNCNQYFCEGEFEVKPPHQLTPAFYGCLDWHSAVHNHWLLIRLMRWYPDAEFCSAAKEAIAYNLTPEKISGETAYLQRKPNFERPYGLAWLLQLTAELREWQNAYSKEWLAILQPLEEAVKTNLYNWLSGLSIPARIGTHRQTAFALGLVWDWAKTTDNSEFAFLLEKKGREFYDSDRHYPWAIEPLGYDFLSPSLASADLMRRLLPPVEFAQWLSDFLPDLSKNQNIFQPARVDDPADYQQSHLDGLNLSRAWMLEGIISGLPEEDGRREFLQARARLHRQVGLAAVSDRHYAGSHWLGSFAVYLVTRRGFS
ncbi:MAG: DUF2891 domain-containing protein [Cyanobacteriota bacterium]|nr:DUF2891 domain-containing protein [Cyanobacteriota bacterium]